MKCSVINCKNKKKFTFPSNHLRKKMWLEAIGRPTFVPSLNHGLCIQHFDPEDVITESYRDGYKLQKQRLKQGAVPVQIPWQIENFEKVEFGAVNVEEHFPNKSTLESSTTDEAEQPPNCEDKEDLLDEISYSNEYLEEYSTEMCNGRTPFPSELFNSSAGTNENNAEDDNDNSYSNECTEEYSGEMSYEQTPSFSELFSNSVDAENGIELTLPNSNYLDIQCNIEVYEEEVYSNVEYSEINASEPSDCCRNTEQNVFKEKKRSIASQTYTTSRYTITDFINKPKSVLHFTGLENYEKFLTVLYSLGPGVYHLKYIRSTVGNLDIPDQLFLVLWKLRRYPSDFELSEHFNIPQIAVGNIFITWIIFMSKTWSLIDIWPSRELINFYMPETFKRNYPTARVIVDGTEIKTEAPSNPRQKQSSFSTYKNAPTHKVLAGGSPGGLISYISPAYGGSTSDRQIVERSDLLKKCESGDTLIGDKGFLVQDIFAPYNVTVLTPTPLVTGSIPHKTIMKDRKLSKHRVHIERLIGLLKTFTILAKKLNDYYVPLTSEIVGVCVVLTNFKENIMNLRK